MGNSTRRTDLHNAVNLKTEDYQYLGSLDWRAGQSGEPGSVSARMALLNAVIIEPRRNWAGIHGSGQCDHCGSALRYAALMLHTPSNTVLEVGETCLENRFSRATEDFQELRKAAELDRAAHRIRGLRAEFVAANPDLVFLDSGEIPAESSRNTFIQDVSRKLQQYGELSVRQIEAVRTSLEKDRVKAAARIVRESLPKTPVIVGKGMITGEVVSTKWQDSQFGSTFKMLVRDDRGFTVFGTVPAKIQSQVEKGVRVQFSATISESGKGPDYGYFSRPTLPKVM